MSLEGQIVSNSMQMNLISLAKDIYHLVGNTATLIEKPEGVTATVLVLYAEAGDFRVQLGDTVADIVETAPPSSNTDGDGSWLIKEGQPVAFTAPARITVKGGSGGVLTYYWL